ncbi:putative ribonuclease H-like domain-containing protein [Tanacetum coccineum]
MAFVSSPSSTNEVNTAYGVSIANTQVSPASTQVSTASTQVSTANLNDLEEMDLKWQLALLSMRTRRFFQKTSRKITINGSDIAGYDNSKVECFNCHKMGHFARECRGPRNQDSMNMNQDSSRRTVNVEEISSKAMVAIDGADNSYKDSEISLLKSELEKLKHEKESSQLKIENFDNASKSLDKLIGCQITDKSRNGVGFVSYNVVLPPHTGLFSPPNLDLSYSSLEEFQQHKFERYGPKTSKTVSEDISNEVRESLYAQLVKELVLDDKLEKKTVFPTVAKIEFARPKQQEKPVREPVKYVEMYMSQSPRENQRNWNNQNYSAKKGHPSAHKNMVPRGVLMKTGLRPLNTVRPVNTAHPKTTVYSARPMSRFSKSAQSTVNVVKIQDRHDDQEQSYLSYFKDFDEDNVTFWERSQRIKNYWLTRVQATLDESMLWHRRLGHVNFKTINKLVKENLVRGLPTKRFENDQTCVACLKGKQHKASCKSKIQNSITTANIHVAMGDLFGPTFVSSLMNKKYCLVVTDDYSRFTWVFFLATKDETSGILKSFITEIENLVDKKVKIIRCDNGTEFKNRVMSEFCEKKGIKKEFSVARTPQQNGVAERRNRTLIEAARTMLMQTLSKFDGKSDEGFFVGYSLNSKAFRVYNIRTRKVEENLHIRFLEDKPIIAGDGPKWLFELDVLTKSMNYVLVVTGRNSNDFVGTEESIGAGHSSKETRSSQDYILMPLWKDGSLFDSSSKNASNDEPQPPSDTGKNDDEGVCKERGIDDQERPKNSTQDVNTAGPSINTEPDMFSLGDNATLEATYADFFGDETKVDMSNITTAYLVSSTSNTRIHKDHSLDHVIGDVQSGEEPKRIAKALSNSAWVEAMQEELLQFKLQKGHTQEEGIDYDEVFALIARIEAIRLFLAYASFMGFMIIQKWMVKVLSFYGELKRRHMLCQPLGELAFFLGLQVKQKEDGIFISQDKYVANILRKFSFTDVRTTSTPIDTEKPLLKDSDGDDVDVHLYRSMIGSLMYLTSSRPDIMFAYPRDSSFDLVAYSDSDYAGASLDRKSTTGGCQFLGCRLISWQCKKQTVVATSSTEAEYVAATSCCGQGFAAALAVLVTGASQSRQHESHHRFFPVDTSLIHIESRKSPTKSLFDVGSRRISIFTVNTKEYHSDVLAIITRIMRRT